MRNSILLLFSISITINASRAQSDKTVFTIDQMLWLVENYHPVSQQGKLLIDKGESTVLKSRGLFDPYIYGSINEKKYQDKDYYSIFNSGLKVPTWYGVEFKTGLDQNSGVYLNPERNIPTGGLWYTGISMNLGQGLVIDKRRAALKQALLLANATHLERQFLINQLYFDAIKNYWKWVESWNQYQVNQNSVVLAQERFKAIKQSHRLGDRPAIDTLEAYIQVQNRTVNTNQSLLNYKNSTLSLSDFLWFENNTPLIITDSLRPPLLAEINYINAISNDSIQKAINRLEQVHPEMQLYDFKLATLDIDKKLKIEGLKPKLSVNYNALTEPIGSDVFSNFSLQNYKWGIEMSFPVLLRQERGDLQLTRIKIKETELNRQQKLLELQNKLKAYYNEQTNLNEQLTLYQNVVLNYNSLLEGEKQKFIGGESSLFLINSRETNYLQSQIKLTEIVAKYNITHAAIQFALGNLAELD